MGAGVPTTAEFRTSSPAILLDSGRSYAATNAATTPQDILRLDASTLPFTLKLQSIFENDSTHPDYGLLSARVALNFQTLVLRAMAIRDEDFERAVAYCVLDTGSAELDRYYNPPWSRLFARHSSALDIAVQRDALPPLQLGAHTNSTILTRLRFEDRASIGFRLLLNVWDRLPFVSPRGTILVQSTNGLLKELAYHMALRGYSLRTIEPKTSDRKTDGSIDRDVRTRLRQAAEAHVRDWVARPVVEPLADMFLEQVGKAILRYETALPGWRDALSAASALRPAALLANYPLRPELVALYRACRERNMTLVTAQHGVSREINAQLPNARAYYENNASDIFFTYNDRAADIADNENEFARGISVAVGMPRSYLRAGRYRKPNKEKPPVFYVSTMNYIGNIQMVQSGGPDSEKARFEIALIDNVLSRLPHAVLYKAYPVRNSRYLDSDPVLACAHAADNVNVYDDDDDLRYLLPDSRVLIASRGMSTVGFCLLADRPLVYIDIPTEVRLRPDVRQAFEEAVFLFDGGDQNLHDKIVQFLSKPLCEIDELWQQKAVARYQLIENSVSKGGDGAGKRAADYLQRFLKANSGQAGTLCPI